MKFFGPRQLRQKAVYWPLLSQNMYGEDTYDSPVEIDCQWNDTAIDIVDWKGQHTVTKSQVMVDRDVVIGGLLVRGVLADINNPELPLEVPRIERIIRFDKVPRVRADEFMRVAYV